MIEKKLKLVQWLLYGLMGISALLTVLFYLNSSPDLLLYWGYTLVIGSIVIVLSIIIIQIVKNPKRSMKILFIVGIMLIVGFLAYALSKNTLTPDQLEKYSISPSGVRLVGAGLLMTYFIMLAAIGVFIYTSLYRFFK